MWLYSIRLSIILDIYFHDYNSGLLFYRFWVFYRAKQDGIVLLIICLLSLVKVCNDIF
jgi:hypothetical protein